MSEPTDPREREALERAHAECPCRRVSEIAYICCSDDNDDACCIHCGYPEHARKAPCKWPGHAAIVAYGRAVREADKEAARNGYPLATVFSGEDDDRLYAEGRKDAAAAIEALKQQ